MPGSATLTGPTPGSATLTGRGACTVIRQNTHRVASRLPEPVKKVLPAPEM
ncbi:hypothetical protein LTSEGIV_1165 [Salmonella enterica subsp. enterica serovar Give str. S5-487]|nr:hypothetical protein LTSEGIV_1165 [Salmonella enterica subsp. enterica serovar Give str. S5-487]